MSFEAFWEDIENYAAEEDFSWTVGDVTLSYDASATTLAAGATMLALAATL